MIYSIPHCSSTKFSLKACHLIERRKTRGEADIENHFEEYRDFIIEANEVHRHKKF